MSSVPVSRLAAARWWGALGAIVAAAALLRLCNLGTFSFGLDEGFTITRAVLPFREMIAACAADATNPPLYLVITYCSLRLGLVDPWLRLVPIAAGLASIVTWSWWARRHFGSTASLLLAGFMALSTYHVRYSQELRAYPYLILVSGVAMLAGDRLRARPGPRPAAALAVLIALGWYLHFSFALVLAPLVGLVLFGWEKTAAPEPALRRKSAAWLAVALAAGTAAFLPWFLSVRETLGGRLSQGANDWGLELVGRRWQFLTVATAEGESLDWLGGALAVVAAAGLAVALRRRVGRTVLLSAVAAIVVSEALMVAVNRWTQGRYNAAVWPLLAILIALGLERLTRGLRWRWLRAAVLAALALLVLARVDSFHRLGRPHWDRVAAAIEQTRRPGEPVLCENSWSQLYVDYYLGEPVVSLRHSADRLRAAAAESESVLLFVPAREGGREIPRLARRGALIARVPQTGTLYRLRPDSLGLDSGPAAAAWPVPAADLAATGIEDVPRGCLARMLGLRPAPDPAATLWSRLELDGSSAAFLRSGWSSPRRAADGGSFRWVLGHEAAVVASMPAAGAARIGLRLWPQRGLEGQELRLLVNGRELGTRALGRGPQTVELGAPAESWREGPNLLVIQLRQVVDPGDGREPPQSAAVDWIEITPAAQRGSTAAAALSSSSR
ncbi:MAG TPA: hypothetical protein PLS95_07265 [Thermoanaerobaculales bacterium]|nr:hypothetical protein [Thermoanaerobaculales bacterium]